MFVDIGGRPSIVVGARRDEVSTGRPCCAIRSFDRALSGAVRFDSAAKH